MYLNQTNANIKKNSSKKAQSMHGYCRRLVITNIIINLVVVTTVVVVFIMTSSTQENVSFVRCDIMTGKDDIKVRGYYIHLPFKQNTCTT